MVDISALKPSNRTIEIKHPATGSPIGVRVTIVSVDDDKLQEMKRQILDRRLYLEQRNKTFKAEEVEQNQLKMLFTATRGWEWYNPTGAAGDDDYDADATPEFEGEVPTFNERNFKRIHAALPWFTDQINEEVGERKLFFDNSKAD